jgi:hypothetical protein
MRLEVQQILKKKNLIGSVEKVLMPRQSASMEKGLAWERPAELFHQSLIS